MNLPIVIGSFLVCLFCFLIIGILSTVKKRDTNIDYLLAGHNVKPWLVALSAVATNNSGYMFIGMIGFTYMTGLSSIWLMIGWVLGDLLMSFIVHPKLRVVTEKTQSLSFSEVLGKWQGSDYKTFRYVAGAITVVFLGTYAAAQFKAGSKALHVLFGWDLKIGAIIGAIMVLLYCFAGGIRASIWTDAAQSFVMIIAMLLLCIISVVKLGGFAFFWESLGDVSPTFLNWLPPNLPLHALGPILFIGGWFAAGIAVIGQPHIMVRFMAVNSVENMGRVRIYYYLWYVSFYVLTIGVGLASRLLLPSIEAFDAELALPLLSLQMLPAILVGLVLAGLFSATMSTADSQILSCTASVTRDLIPQYTRKFYLTKLTTIGVTSVALLIALFAPSNVFTLVLVAWSGLASSFAPLMILFAFNYKVTEKTAIIMTLTGLLTVILWRFTGLNAYVYEVLPGILSGFAVYAATKGHKIKTL